LTQVKLAQSLELTQVKANPRAKPYHFKIESRKAAQEPAKETVMTELSEQNAAVGEQLETASKRFTLANKNTLEFMMGAQKLLLEEMVFTGNEVLDRARTEMHLFTEFVSKMAGVHSVKDMKTMFEECGHHQIDFVRRDAERLFRHGEHMIETTSNLLSKRPPN
jgi:PleD family two-component response regulator